MGLMCLAVNIVEVSLEYPLVVCLTLCEPGRAEIPTCILNLGLDASDLAELELRCGSAFFPSIDKVGSGSEKRFPCCLKVILSRMMSGQ